VEEAKQEAMSEQADFTLVGVSDDRGGVPVPATAAAVNTVIDTAKLETKGTASGFPIRTMGDLQRFSQPNPACPSYTQTVRDIKGIGDAGFDRIGEAELMFWGWWRAGGEAEFAAELAAKDAPAAPESEAA
jgi:hypothetical protein